MKSEMASLKKTYATKTYNNIFTTMTNIYIQIYRQVDREIDR